MKTYITLSILLLCPILVLSENFPTLSGLSRTVMDEYVEDCTMQNTTYVVHPIKEVTIEGKQYLQFQERNICLREADNKVYLYSGEGTEDLVLYDYTLGVGDVLHQIVLHEGEEPTFSYMSEDVLGSIITVTKVEPVTLLDGKEYKKWTFDNGMEYVETIGSYGNGSLAGDFFQMVVRPIPTCLLSVHCVCISRNGQLLYEMPSAEQERLHTYCMSASTKDAYFVQGQVWSYRITDLCDGEVPTTYIYRMSVSGDTVINQNRYMMLESVPVRENGKQVFAHYNNRDVLIYDFGLQVGDKIASPSGDESATVVATDSVTLLDGRRAKRIQYDRRATDIEYVGSTSDAGVLAPLFGENIPPCGGQQFLCCSVRGELVFETSTGSCDIPETAVQNVTASLYGMQDGVITLKTPTAQTRLYDMRGCCLLQTTQSSIDISAFSGGMYILHIVFPTGEKAVAKIATR